MKIGEVTHYYNKIDVAIIKLKAPLKAGDTIRFLHANGEEVGEQKIQSMQVDHKDITSGKKGDEIGIKVEVPAREGMTVELAK
jgi:putative protease